MSKNTRNLRFNFGYLLEADRGTRRVTELSYPSMQLEEVHLSPLDGRFQATKTTNGIYIEGVLTSGLQVDCARCLKPVAVPVEMELSELYYYPPPPPAGEFAVGDDGVLDLGPLVRELALLSAPARVFCTEGCLGLCNQCGQNLNESACDCERDTIDPRLAVLRTLLEED